MAGPFCTLSQTHSKKQYRAIKSVCPDAISRHHIDKDEIDVFIPSLNLGFEYDGQRFHNLEKLPKDIAKSKRLIRKGITLYRFRESECPIFDLEKCLVIQIKYSPEYEDLEVKLKELLVKLLPQKQNIDFNFKNEINEVRATLDCLPYEQSFAAAESKKRKKGIEPVALWDYEANAPLTPEMVTPKSTKCVNWICPNNPNHKWKGRIASVSDGFGCKECSG